MTPQPISAHGVRADVPPGWDARIYRRSDPTEATQHVIFHAATFPLPEERGDFGSGAVERMLVGDVFVSLVEYHPDAVRTPLFHREGLPTPLAGSAFDPATLQRSLPGQAGAQFFFNSAGRAWCLYVVIGSAFLRRLAAVRANHLLDTVELSELGS